MQMMEENAELNERVSRLLEENEALQQRVQSVLNPRSPPAEAGAAAEAEVRIIDSTPHNLAPLWCACRWAVKLHLWLHILSGFETAFRKCI